MESESNLEARAIELIDFLKRPNSIEETAETLAMLSSDQSLFPIFLLLIQKNDPSNDQILMVLSKFIYKNLSRKDAWNQAFDLYGQTIADLSLAGIGIPYFKDFFTMTPDLFEKERFFIDMFGQLVEITKECGENQFTNPDQVQYLSYILQVIDNYRRGFRQDQASPIEFEPYLVEFFPAFFTIDNILNPNLTQAVKTITESCFLMFRYSFSFFLQTNVFDQILDIILFLAQIVAEKRKIDKTVTSVLIDITKYFVSGIFEWIVDLESRYDAEKSLFIPKYGERLIVQFAMISKEIQHYFTYDIYDTIPHRLLNCLSLYLFVLNPQLPEAEFEAFYELALMYMELPPAVEQDFSDNPIMYYQNAYCLSNDRMMIDPRGFSVAMLHYLLDANPAKTLECLFVSPGSQRIPLWGFAIKYLESQSFFDKFLEENEAEANALIGQIIENIGIMINEPTENEYDKLFLLICSCRFIPDESKQDLLERAQVYLNDFNTTTQTDPDSVTEMHKFLFSFGCSIIQALLSVEFPIGDNLPTIIEIILQNFDACSTDDAINAIIQMISTGLLNPILNQVIPFLIHTIRTKTDDFYHDIMTIDEYDSIILNQVFKALELCLSASDQEPLVLFDKIFTSYFENKEDIDEFNEYFTRLIHSVVVSGWSEIPQILSRLLNESIGCKNLFANQPLDIFLDPFYLFITQDIDGFTNWESLPQFIQFMIDLFSSVPISNELDMYPCDMFYFTSKMFSMMIMGNIELDLDFLLTKAIERLQSTEFPSPEYPDNFIIYFGCFDIITTIVIKNRVEIPDDVMEKFEAFVDNGFVCRTSEKARYSLFCQLLKQSGNPKYAENMDSLTMNILTNDKKPVILDLNWFERQTIYGNF